MESANDDFESTPLVFNLNKDKIENIENILLIDDTVFQNEIFYNSANSKTLSIKYSIHSSTEELEKLLNDNFTKIKRIGFIFDDSLINYKQFLDSNLFFNNDDFSKSKQDEYSPNLKFIINLAKKFNVENLDYLVCNSLKYENWVKYFEILKKETNSIIGASKNKTGNIKYGGDWILESTNENVKNIYWNEKINNYKSTLITDTISTSTTILNSDINNYTWPVTINGGTQGSTVIVTLGDDITLTDVSQYFIIGSDYITIDGSSNNVIIDGVENWLGLVKNGTSQTFGYSNTTIQNINMNTSGGSTLANYYGWICWEYFCSGSNFNEVNNCSSNGNINFNCGGISGQYTSSNNGSIVFNNCNSSGDIGNSAGGISGYYFCYNQGNATINNCFSTGNIDAEGGGITGQGTGKLQGTVSYNNCYSSGNIGTWAGGIVGYNAYSSTITNCYSTGAISGENSGGIMGRLSTSSIITNSFSYGTVTGTGANGMVGDNSSGITQINCYVADGNWSNTDALANLTGTPTYDSSGNLVTPCGNVWADVFVTGNFTTWIFSTLGYSPYTTELTDTFSQTILQSRSSDSAIDSSGHTYSIISINDQLPSEFPSITITSSNGSIQTLIDTPVGTYNIKILQNSDYSITNFDLTIDLICFVEGTKILCLKNNKEEYVKIEELKMGDLVKTLTDSYVSVKMIGMNEFQNNPSSKENSIYKFNDLMVTGKHILLTDWNKKDKLKYVRDSKTDDKYRIMAYKDDRFNQVIDDKKYTIYNIVLHETKQYGIWAEGVLTESANMKTMKKYGYKILNKN